jgi:putative flippase GtrA
MKLNRRFLRFALVGGIATGIQYLILITLVSSGLMGPVLASTIGFVVSTLANYQLNRSYTFGSTAAHGHTLPRFAVVALSGLSINAVLIWLFLSFVSLHYIIAQILATGGTLVWNFSLNHVWTFATPPPSLVPQDRTEHVQ